MNDFFDEDGAVTALKAGFLGFGGAGKTYTAALLACAAREVFKLDGPIAMYDSEAGSAYVEPAVLKLTGKPLLKKRARDLRTLIDFGKNCQREGVSCAIVDSITHPWREACASYLAQVNADRTRSGRAPLAKLEPHHYGTIKEMWQEWTDFYLNSGLSIIICGRAGFEFGNEVNDETGRRELVRTGIKMKTEGEMGYEPSLLVLMEQEQELLRDAKRPTVHRTAAVLKDRFRDLDGRTVEFKSTGGLTAHYRAVKKFFLPHLQQITPGAAPSGVDTQTRTRFEIADGAEAGMRTEMRERDVLRDEIQYILSKRWPGQTNAEKTARIDMVAEVFGRPSWAYVESLNAATLRAGRDKIIALTGQDARPTVLPEG